MTYDNLFEKLHVTDEQTQDKLKRVVDALKEKLATVENIVRRGKGVTIDLVRLPQISYS
jgi:hypothetical protein